MYNIGMPTTLNQIKLRHELLAPVLNEKQYRIYLASEAKALGWGGVSKVAQATSASRNTISSGMDELTKPLFQKSVKGVTEGKKVRQRRRGRRLPVAEALRQRQRGGGRKRTTDIDATLKTDLDALLEPFAAGDPCSLRIPINPARHSRNKRPLVGAKRRGSSNSIIVAGLRA